MVLQSVDGWQKADAAECQHQRPGHSSLTGTVVPGHSDTNGLLPPA